MHFLALIIVIFLASSEARAQSFLPTTLEADKVDGDRKTNVIEASGNVEIKRGQDELSADKITYDKNNKTIKATGNIEVKGDNIGNIFAAEAKIKDDFSEGNLKDGQIVFKDGSYATSPNIDRVSKTKTILQKSIFSFCPNPKILEDNNNIKDDSGLIVVTSKQTTIDREEGVAKISSGTVRIKNVPVFYTPYLSFPLKSSKRRSGFLHPSYVNTNNLGFGFKIPYYFNLAPDHDLVTTLQYHPSNNNILLTNNFRQLLKNGNYNVNLELANNNLRSSAEKSSERYKVKSKGDVGFSDNIGLEFDINYVGDKSYLRDYHNDFRGNTTSVVNLDQIEGNDYQSIKAVKLQELEVNVDSREEINAIPVANSYIESKPGKLNETYALQSNATVISRRSGLQYRRVSVKPQIVVPYNISGNIFKLSTSVQTDVYSTDDNYTSTPRTTNFDNFEGVYRPQASLSWNFPLIRKTKKSSFIIEPKITAITSSYSRNIKNLPNEDSNNTELTQGNLFLEDRFVGFDRSESGQRVNYGFTSNLFNAAGKFGFGLGQGYKSNDKNQDVVIKGFNDAKSNIVGEISYKSPKIFSIIYNFQLNESNYANDVNEINTGLTFDRFSITSNYILIRKSIGRINPGRREQFTLGGEAKIYGNLKGYFNATKDLYEDRIIEKKMGVIYDGCCVTYGISVSESNPSRLLQSEKSYNINFAIKNL